MDELGRQLTDRISHFAHALREAGIEADPSATLTFAAAMADLGVEDLSSIYWAGRLSFVKNESEISAYDRVFHAVLNEGDLEERPPHEATGDDGTGTGSGGEGLEEGGAPERDSGAALASSVSVLRQKNFEELTSEELRQLVQLIDRLTFNAPMRASRRVKPAARGDILDLRKMLTTSLRTEGEPIQRHWQRHKPKPRRIVFLLDISGSMRVYSRTLLQFAYTMRRKHRLTEVFCFGTALTRVSDSLDQPTADRALEEVAERISDWEGGTRIADSIGGFLDHWGRRGLARGAVIVICSDGLERGDPSDLARQMARLNRLSHKIVWLNPLKGSSGYEPLVRGMAAALPHVDVFMPGHNLASLEELSGAMATARR